jgi:hypothetical protein
METMLVAAVALFVMLPYGLGIAHARTQGVYGLVGQGSGEDGRNKDAVVAIYGDRMFIAHVDGTRIRAVEMRDFSDVKNVEVSQKEIGRLHW